MKLILIVGADMDRFSKGCLLAIAVLFATVVLRPILFPQPAEAAHRYKYLVAALPSGYPSNTPPPTVQSLLDKYSAEGWELVTVAADGKMFFRK